MRLRATYGVGCAITPETWLIGGPGICCMTLGCIMGPGFVVFAIQFCCGGGGGPSGGGGAPNCGGGGV